METFKQIFESHYAWIEGFMRNVRRHGDKIAMICPDKYRKWSYLQLKTVCCTKFELH